jgi:PPOX class probable F420-dependent enzyme
VTEFLSDAAHELLESGAVATVATLNADGSPHLSVAWVGVEGGEIVFGTLDDQRKLRNLRRYPRIALTVHSDRINAWGLRQYLVIDGTARIAGGPRAGAPAAARADLHRSRRDLPGHARPASGLRDSSPRRTRLRRRVLAPLAYRQSAS